jgi:hypothetical protein
MAIINIFKYKDVKVTLHYVRPLRFKQSVARNVESKVFSGWYTTISITEFY